MYRIVLFLLLITNGLNVWAQEYYGREFRINKNDVDLIYAEDFCAPEVAALKNGNYSVCWTGYKNWNYDIYLQIISPQGQLIGDHVLVNQFTGNTQEDPDIAVLEDGKIVICWESWLQDGNGKGIIARVLNQDGTPYSDEWIVNKSTEYDQFEPAIASLADGGFVIGWVHKVLYNYNEIRAQMYDETGQKIGATEFLVNHYTDLSKFVRFPDVVGLENGGFVFCYQHYKSGEDIFYQMFNSDGSWLGNEALVNTHMNQNQRFPVISNTTHGFLICWEDNVNDMNEDGIFGRTYKSSGQITGDEFLVNSYTIGPQRFPAVVGLDDGYFLVCWKTWRQDLSKYSIVAQFFDSESNVLHEEFPISELTDDIQTSPAVCVSKNGDLLIAWLYSDSPMDNSEAIYGKIVPSQALSYSLERFSLKSPSNDCTLEKRHAKFEWEQPGEIVENYPWEISFDLFISQNPEFDNPVVIKGISDTFFNFTDLENGTTYFWKVLAKSGDDSLWSHETNWGFFVSHSAIGIDEPDPGVPAQYALHQNYPNPFNPTTTISFSLPRPTYVELRIYTISGQLVRTLIRQNIDYGDHIVEWDATADDGTCVSSGIYIYQLKAGGIIQSRKMAFIR